MNAEQVEEKELNLLDKDKNLLADWLNKKIQLYFHGTDNRIVKITGWITNISDNLIIFQSKTETTIINIRDINLIKEIRNNIEETKGWT
jgi:hypothetical protein